MGCGGSRADAIEPRYYESWTRETESTWLTNTDTDPPLPNGPDPAGGLPGGSGSQPAGLTHRGAPDRGILEDGLSTQTCVTLPSAASGIMNTEKKTSCGTQCTKPPVHGSGTLTQKQNGFRSTEVKRDSKRVPSKEVTINVPKSIRPMDSDRRITKNCVN
ncbi:brain and acute leukemia cytoplasmic protein [Tachyglossus aculeatus]|uniref:brain and acute leukemia cytoplasmic protein n=1 Tax=Tachyglossus aculeatus TaxID=9261 RepID=UPI0018F5769D|nr:brain and acute leukemia cytoplasmic protein [Tachyglossus aculeatus]